MLNVKVLCLLGCAFVAITIVPSNAQVLGGVSELSGQKLEDAKEVLQTSLTKLSAGDGPSYRIQEVNSATHQVTAGSLYNFDVDLVNDKNDVKKCKVRIISQAWRENGIEVTFNCVGEETVVKKHSA